MIQGRIYLGSRKGAVAFFGMLEKLTLVFEYRADTRDGGGGERLHGSKSVSSHDVSELNKKITAKTTPSA